MDEQPRNNWVSKIFPAYFGEGVGLSTLLVTWALQLAVIIALLVVAALAGFGLGDLWVFLVAVLASVLVGNLWLARARRQPKQ